MILAARCHHELRLTCDQRNKAKFAQIVGQIKDKQMPQNAPAKVFNKVKMQIKI